MRFLANENFPMASVRHLRAAGHDTAAVIEDSPGARDSLVLKRASDEGRILLTFDRDYGELIYRHKAPVPAGVIYFRLDPSTPKEPAEQLLRVLATPDLLMSRNFTVLERHQVRQRPLPDA
jgi:predicted nuclease of predicted toxin-antitoxin system